MAVGGVTCDYVSVRNCPGTGEDWGAGEELPLLIENFMKHVSWTVSYAQTEIQRPPMEEIFTKMIKILPSTAIFVDRCRSQSLGIVSM
jgi:hypothetical protein